jgi:hypothetical protein
LIYFVKIALDIRHELPLAAVLAGRKFLIELERRIPRRAPQHPPASFPRERSDEQGKVSQRDIVKADSSCDGWGQK